MYFVQHLLIIYVWKRKLLVFLPNFYCLNFRCIKDAVVTEAEFKVFWIVSSLIL